MTTTPAPPYSCATCPHRRPVYGRRCAVWVDVEQAQRDVPRLVERCQRVGPDAYAKARAARFEHGENP